MFTYKYTEIYSILLCGGAKKCNMRTKKYLNEKCFGLKFGEMKNSA